MVFYQARLAARWSQRPKREHPVLALLTSWTFRTVGKSVRAKGLDSSSEMQPQPLLCLKYRVREQPRLI